MFLKHFEVRALNDKRKLGEFWNVVSHVQLIMCSCAHVLWECEKLGEKLKHSENGKSLSNKTFLLT